MDLGIQVPDYSSDLKPVTSGKKQKMKTEYPSFELRGEAAKIYMKAHPDIKIGEEMDCCIHVRVSGLRSEDTDEKRPVDSYGNCVTLSVHSIEPAEGEMNDEGMPKD